MPTEAKITMGWLTTQEGFLKAELVEVGDTYRKLIIKEGEQDGQTMVIPPEGIPNGDLHPAFFEQEEKPEVWRFKGRCLKVVKPEDFVPSGLAKEEKALLIEQIKSLIPQEEPYHFLPHTLQVIDGILAGDHQLMFGPTGVGKTSIILQIAARIGMPTIRLNFNGQTTLGDLVGSVGFGKEGTTWNDGALPRAMRHGFWLLLDEFDFGDPAIQSTFYPVLEAKPKLCLKEHNGEIVEGEPRFRVFATGNSIGQEADGEYHGTQPLNIALLNRFSGHGQVINIQAMNAKQEREVVKKRLPQMPPRLIRRACDCASNFRMGTANQPPLIPTFSPRELINWCTKMLLYRDAVKAASLTFLPLVKDKGVRDGIADAIRARFGKRIILGKTTIPTTVGADGLPVAITAGVGGRSSSMVTDHEEMKAIWKAYRGNGGTLSYEGVEKDPKFNLKVANGNTAYRIIQRYDELLKRGVIKADGETPKAEKPETKAKKAKKETAEDDE